MSRFGFVLLFLCTSMHAARSVGDDAPLKDKQTQLRISRATTRITAPLDQQGYVDYVRAANAFAARGVTPQNNFEVVVRRVVGPESIERSMRKEYHRRLGMPLPQGGFLVGWIALHARDAKPADGLDDAFKKLDKLIEGPWTAAEHPKAAAWLRGIETQLDAVVQGSRRTRQYSPYLTGEPIADMPPFPMLSLLLPSVSDQRELARCLRIRANFRVGAAKFADAWSDIQAIYRMSRLSAQGLTLIEALVGISLDAMAFEGAVRVLRSPKLTDDQARRFLADLKRVPSLPPLADKIDVGERFGGLDAMQSLARQKGTGLFENLKLLNDLSHASAAARVTYVSFQEDATKPAELTINWNKTAGMLNQWYDRFVVAVREQDFEKRRQRFAAIKADLGRMRHEIKDTDESVNRLLRGELSDESGIILGKVLVLLMMPALEHASKAQHAATVRLDLVRLAFAAEVYRRDRQIYPKQLAELSPTYVKRVPLDSLTGKRLRYTANERQFVVYSVGRNGRDDGGRAEKMPREDDIAIRILRDR